MRHLVRTVAAAAVIAAAGCADSAPPAARPGGASPPDTPGAPPPRSAPAARVEVLPIRYAGLDAAIKEQKGKVVLVDVWSLT